MRDWTFDRRIAGRGGRYGRFLNLEKTPARLPPTRGADGSTALQVVDNSPGTSMFFGSDDPCSPFLVVPHGCMRINMKIYAQTKKSKETETKSELVLGRAWRPPNWCKVKVIVVNN